MMGVTMIAAFHCRRLLRDDDRRSLVDDVRDKERSASAAAGVLSALLMSWISSASSAWLDVATIAAAPWLGGTAAIAAFAETVAPGS